MSKVQLTPKEKLKRDLEEFIALRKAHGSAERDALLRKWIKRKFQITEQELNARSERHAAMGSPALDSPEWQAELRRMRKPRRGKQPAPPRNTDPNDIASLFWSRMLLASRQASGEPVELIPVPGQFLENQDKAQRAEAARMYRWLWQNFPGLLRACNPELRKLIRHAGGIA